LISLKPSFFDYYFMKYKKDKLKCQIAKIRDEELMIPTEKVEQKTKASVWCCWRSKRRDI